MEMWICEDCGTGFEGVEPPERCEYCGCRSFDVEDAIEEEIARDHLLDLGKPGSDWEAEA